MGQPLTILILRAFLFRFCYWYSLFKEKQTKHPFNNLFLQTIHLFSLPVPVLVTRVFCRCLWGFGSVPKMGWGCMTSLPVHSSSYWLPFPLPKFHGWAIALRCPKQAAAKGCLGFLILPADNGRIAGVQNLSFPLQCVPEVTKWGTSPQLPTNI